MYTPVARRFLFIDHPNSKGLNLARRFFREMLPVSPRLTQSAEFRWITEALLHSPRYTEKTDTLIERLAAFMLYDSQHKAFKNHKHLIRTFASQTMKFAQVPLNPERNWKTGAPKKLAETKQGRLLQTLGDAIWNVTGPFWIAVNRQIEKEQQTKDQFSHDLMQVV